MKKIAGTCGIAFGALGIHDSSKAGGKDCMSCGLQNPGEMALQDRTIPYSLAIFHAALRFLASPQLLVQQRLPWGLGLRSISSFR